MLIAVAALRGWWAGALLQALTLGGFWLGLALGFLAAPIVAVAAHGFARTVLLLGWLGVASLLGALCGAAVGARLRPRVWRGGLAMGDRVLGAGVGALAALTALWLIGTVLAASGPGWLARPLQRSSVLGAMDAVMPDPPTVFARVESLFNHAGFPVVLVNLPPGLAAPQALPSQGAVRASTAAVAEATVKVIGEACGLFHSGSGFVAPGNLVVTNAHVVAGERTTSVADGSRLHAASVVVYDPALDIAVLRVPGLDAPPVVTASAPVAAGTTAAVVGFPQGGALRGAPAAINARFEAVGLDIYGRALTSRDVYELHAAVEPGNSGGPLVAASTPSGSRLRAGTVIGVVFARAPSDPDIGYALALAPVDADIAAARTVATAVRTGACLP